MRLLISFLFTMLFAFGMTAKAADVLPQRAVTLDWDPIPEAEFYDVEIQARDAQGKTVGKPKVSLTKEAVYKGMLVPGYYAMRVRGKDHRKVPGEWSDSMDLTIMLENTKVNQPSKLHILQSQNPETEKFTFKWLPVPGALKYTVAVENEDKTFQQINDSSDLAYEIKVPVGQRLTWKIRAIGDNGLMSESETEGIMEVWGPSLETPKVAKPETRFVREVTWAGSNLDKSYSARLDRWDEPSKKWLELKSQKALSEAKMEFPPDAPGGKYRVIVKSEAPLRRPSKLGFISFPVVNGDRSPAAEYRATLRESIERTKGWFVIASYLFSNIKYNGSNFDNISTNRIGASFKSTGGTGRLGAGYLPEKSPWGFLGILEYSGFFIGNETPTYSSMELNGVRRTESGQIGEIRQQLGLYYKELPEIVPMNNSQFAISTIAAYGLHYGAEYWWALSPKLGFQVNAHLYQNLGSAKTPNGNNITPSGSFQVGLLGSYRLWSSATGLMGYAYRQDNLSYRATTGGRNNVEISGHYINFFLEWAL